MNVYRQKVKSIFDPILGISLTELARRFGVSVPEVGYSVERGEIITRENDNQLIE